MLVERSPCIVAMVGVLDLVDHPVDMLNLLLDPVVRLAAELLLVLRHECERAVRILDINRALR